MAREGGKAPRSRARRLVIVLASVTALVSAAAILAPRLVPAGPLARRVELALAEASGAEVTVGAVSPTLLGGPGLRLGDVRIERADGLVARLDVVTASLAIRPLLRRELVLDALTASGPVARGQWRGRALELTDLRLRARDLWLPLPCEAEVATASPPAAIGAADISPLPAELVGSATLTAARADWSGFVLAPLTVVGGVDRRVVNVDSLAGGCGGGHLLLRGRADLADAANGELTGTLALTAVEATALLGAWVPSVASRLRTTLTGSANVGCRLVEGASAPVDLQAAVALDCGDGLLRAGDWLSGAAPYLGQRQDLVDIRIARGRLVARLAGDSCRLDTLSITGPDTDWFLAGEVDLTGALDLGVQLRLPPGFTPVLGPLTMFAEAMRDGDGRVNLDLRLRGPLAEPAVNLDLASMSRRMRRPAPASGGAGAVGGSATKPAGGLAAILDKWKAK